MKNEIHDDFIDLGAVSVETKGGPVGSEDTGGLIPFAGISDE